MVLKIECQRQTEFWMGECTLIVLDELMTLLVQRLNEWIILWLVAWYNEGHKFFIGTQLKLSDLYRSLVLTKDLRSRY